MGYEIGYYKDLLLIDKDNLDTELIQQSSIFYQISDSLTESIADRDAKKDKLLNADSQVSTRFRLISEGETKKWTEGKILENVQLSSEHKVANALYLQAKETVGKWSALQEAFLQRSSMLKYLVNLYTSDYFTRESISVKTGAASGITAEHIKKGMSETRKPRKRRD